MPNARGSILPLSKLVAALTWSRCCALVASRCRSAAAVGAHLVAAVAGRGAHLVAAVGACCRSSPRRSRCCALVEVLRPGRGAEDQRPSALTWSRCSRRSREDQRPSLVEVLTWSRPSRRSPGRGAAPWSRCGRSAAVGAHLVAAVGACCRSSRDGRGAHLVASRCRSAAVARESLPISGRRGACGLNRF